MKKIMILMSVMLLVCDLFNGCGYYADKSEQETEATESAAINKKEVQQSPEIQPSTTVSNKPEHTMNISSVDKGAGYPHGNPENYQRFVCSDGEWVYAVQDILLEEWDLANGCAIVRFRKDGTDMQTLCEFPEKNRDNSSSIFCLNVRNDWLVFVLYQRKNGIKHHYICKMKNDGTHFKKIQDTYVYDLYLYKNRIYYSLFTKWGGKDIYSMDMNGEDQKLLVEKDTGLEFEVADNKIYAFFSYENENIDRNTEDYSLYEMDLQGNKKEKLMDIKDAYGSTFCLWGNSVFFMNEDEQLCRQEIGDTKASAILSMEDNNYEYCFYDDYIYLIDDDLYRISIDGGDLTAYHKKDVVKKLYFLGFCDRQIYLEDHDDNLVLMDCEDGKTSKIKREAKKL